MAAPIPRRGSRRRSGVVEVWTFDVMKYVTLRVFSLVLALTSVPSWAGAQSLLPGLYGEFSSRLEAAVEHRDLAAIQALYQTNGVAAQELKLEMARWPDLLAGDAKGREGLYFKELSTLPPQAREAHTERARRLTKHEVTHLVLVRLPAGYQLTLPLVLVGDKLQVVPSERRNTASSIEPNGAANGSQPIRSETNQTPPAAGSRR